MASPWQKRTSQLSFVNAGPAASRPVECLVRVISFRMRGVLKHELQQRNVYYYYYYYPCYHIHGGYLKLYKG
jgi:hypothetical protein